MNTIRHVTPYVLYLTFVTDAASGAVVSVFTPTVGILVSAIGMMFVSALLGAFMHEYTRQLVIKTEEIISGQYPTHKVYDSIKVNIIFLSVRILAYVSLFVIDTTYNGHPNLWFAICICVFTGLNTVMLYVYHRYSKFIR